MISTRNIYTVQEITQVLSDVISSEPMLQDLWIKGEVSGFTRANSGHIYFTLKDDKSQIKCVIFRAMAARLQFLPEHGDAVLVHGKLNIYDGRSEYQIVSDWVEPVGVGRLQLAFERLKEKLADEGLFSPIHKKPLPKFPRKIGVITSPTGAAIRDILGMLKKRYPVAEVFLYPTLVQGEKAAEQIAEAVTRMNRLPDIDVLIVGRGGGSIEDLWAFNEEVLARAIFASRIPIVSAVGHEIDFTITDFVADLRAPTPSAAVEYIVPDQQEIKYKLSQFESRLERSIAGRIESVRMNLVHTENRLKPIRQIDSINRLHQMIDQLEIRSQQAMKQQLSHPRQQMIRLNADLISLSPASQLQNLRHRLDRLTQMLQSLTTQRIKTKAEVLRITVSRLNALNPLATLGRGYSVCKDFEGKTITDASQVRVGDELEIQLLRGALTCTITNKSKGEVYEKKDEL